MKPESLPVKVWRACLPTHRRRQGAKIPADVKKAVNEVYWMPGNGNVVFPLLLGRRSFSEKLYSIVL
ncbi:MAG: hypothetical protein KKH04_12135 [Proteobacteria bacterium]|nr:hypothetical protein [Pseudomonadota bacterium]